jgi:putative glutamine amidotransferase
MSDRPVIGVTTQTLEAIPGELPRCWVMSQRYVNVLVGSGAVPWIIPLLEGDETTMREIYERLDGLFLPGGVDMDPTTYGEEKGPHCGRVDPARDWAELLMVKWALEDHKPILAVCRGAQVLNVAFGGTLWQDLQAHYPDSIKHDYFPSGGHSRDDLTHDVVLVAGSRLASVIGSAPIPVNSMHHQGIARLAPGLVSRATAPDGLIEAVETTDGRFVLGVQWHPEDLVDVDPRMRRLFDAFIAESREA